MQFGSSAISDCPKDDVGGGNGFEYDGFILQTITQFSEGGTGYNRAGVHVLWDAGIFGVTTAVIDPLGAGSTAQTSFTVPIKPR